MTSRFRITISLKKQKATITKQKIKKQKQTRTKHNCENRPNCDFLPLLIFFEL